MGGKARPRRFAPPDYQMTSPVRCLHCRVIYDMGAVQTIDRHLDCSTWHCPGCKLLVDDRCLGGWGGRRDVERVEMIPLGYELHRVDIRGNMYADRVIYPSHNGLYPI